MLLLLLLLLSPGDSQAHRVSGQRKNGSCVCAVDSKLWSFPAVKYETVLQQVQSCEASVNTMQEQVMLSGQRFPQYQAIVENVTARLEPHQYLHNQGLYTALGFRMLGQELSQLETDIGAIHSQLNNAQTKKLTNEVDKLRTDVDRMQMSDTLNMKAVKERLRYLKNTAESCRSIPKDFKGVKRYCLKGLITAISDPVVSTLNPHDKSYTSGSWGKQAQMDSKEQKNSYWVQPLASGNIRGNVLRVYPTYDDLGTTNYKDYTIAASYTQAESIQGPSAVLYGEALYYHCYNSADVCRYDLNSNAVTRVTLPGTGVGDNDKFPYCYYECQPYSDVDVEADETGLWALYASAGNHGNLVVSQLVWDNEAKTLNVTQTWETRLFKKAVSNAFMVCGVMYATRFVNKYREEVFYAFDTATGKDDNSLALPLEKVANRVSSLSYNPTNQQLYMYNDGYLMAYQAYF